MTPRPQRFVSTFTLATRGRVWTVVSGGSPETGPLAEPSRALEVFRQGQSILDDAIPVWDGDNERFTTWVAYRAAQSSTSSSPTAR